MKPCFKYTKQFDDDLKLFLNLYNQNKDNDKYSIAFNRIASQISYGSKKLFNKLDKSRDGKLQGNEIEQFFNYFKEDPNNPDELFELDDTHIKLFLSRSKVKVSELADKCDGEIFDVFRSLKDEISRIVDKYREEQEYKNITYTDEFENENNFLNDYSSKNKRNNLFKLRKSECQKLGNEVIKLYEHFDTNNDKLLSQEEMQKFILALKGGDKEKTSFNFDESNIADFKTTAGIGEETNIDIKSIKQFFQAIAKNITINSLNFGIEYSGDIEVNSDIEEHINNLTTEISFDTKDDKFKTILSAFDTDNKNDKLSKSEIQKLWNEIKNSCTTNQNGTQIFDKDKIQKFIKQKFPQKNILVDDILSFIKTIELSIENVRPKPPIDWQSAGINEPNAEMDKSFNQHGVGDCWLIATMLGLLNSQRGTDLLNSCLRKDSSGNIYVHLKGPNETFIVTPSELAQSNSNFAFGDGDARAIEIAVDKFYKKRGARDGLSGSFLPAAMYLLTGIDERSGGNLYGSEKITDEALNNIDFKNELVVVGAPFERVKNPKLCAGHAYAVIKVDGDNVYLAEPNQGGHSGGYTLGINGLVRTGEEIFDLNLEENAIVVTRKEFADFFGNMARFSFDNIDKKKEPVKKPNNTATQKEPTQKEKTYTPADAIEYDSNEFKQLKKRTRWQNDWMIECEIGDLNKRQKDIISRIKDGKSFHKDITLSGIKKIINLLTDNGKKEKINFDEATIKKVRDSLNLSAEDATDSDIIGLYNMIMEWMIKENKQPKETRN